MRQKLFTYILAALCAAAAFSCKKAEEDFFVDPSQEREVFLSASLGLDTRATSVSPEAITSTWQEGDEMPLVYKGEVITTLKVTSIFGNKAMLSGKVKGAYPVGAKFDLYYGGTSYVYYGQDGTAASAASRAYLKATDVAISQQDNNVLTLAAATLQHQQAYFQLQFQFGPDLIKVRKLTVENLDPAANDPTVVAGNIVQTWSLDHPDDYTKFSADSPFTVYNSDTEGATTVFFALRDNAPADVACKYRFTVTDIAGRTYTAHAKEMPAVGPVQNGHYYSGLWLLDKKQDGDGATTVAPAAVPGLVYDAQAHDLVTPAMLQDGVSGEAGEGTVVKYFVKYFAPHVNINVAEAAAVPAADAPAALTDASQTESGWVTELPNATETGTYYIFYQIEGGSYYQSVAPAAIAGNPVKIAKRAIDVTAPTAVANLKYTGSAQALVNAGSVKDKNSEEFDPQLVMQYYVTDTDTLDPALTGAEATGWSAEVPQRTNADTYYVWYKVDGSAHFDSLMVNNKPVVGPIAVTIATTDAVIANPVPIENLVYNGTEQQLVLPADASDGCKVYYYVHTTDVDRSVIEALAADQWTTAVPARVSAGTYYIWTKVVDESGAANYTGITGISAAAVVATIDKITLTPTAPTLATGLVYNGSDQALITQAGKLTYVSGTSPTQDASNTTEDPVEEHPAYMQYAVTAASATSAPSADNEWTQNAADIVKLHAGSYKVWYRSLGSANFKPVAPVAVTPNVSIQKATVAVSGIEGAAGLVYNGSSKVLLSNVGSVVYSGGDKDGEEAVGAAMEYYWTRVNIGENSVEETSGTADSPLTAAQVVGTNAGTYTIYYRANGGTNFVSTDWESLEVIFSQATGTLSISPSSLQLMASGPAGVITVTRSPETAVSALSSNTSAATVTVSGTTVTVTPTASGGKATITISVAADANYTTPSAVSCQVQVMTTPTNAVNGLFSVSETKKVFFSKGNLKYSNGSWRFHDNQYDMCFTAVGDVSAQYTISGTFDLFGWGTSGYNSKAPYQTSTTDSDYYSGADIADTEYDWGVHNTISGTKGWRTLTKDEWDYLLNTRTTKSGVRFYSSCSVNSVAGIFIVPDDWENPDPSNITLPGDVSSSAWTTYLEPTGAVFLPVFGFRIGANYQKYNDNVKESYYWTSTHYYQGAETGASCLDILNGTPSIEHVPVRAGAFVRLVIDIPQSGSSGLSDYDVEPEQNW